MADGGLSTVGGCGHGTAEAFDAILALLCERTGTDLTRYRASTVTRRILNRMISVGARTFDDYLTLLRADCSEPPQLLERVTIKVSRFYRNAVTFDPLRALVLPELVRLRGGAPLRVWSAGCGHGEEAYTLAMLLEEAAITGTIEATDIDPGALRTARDARYPATAFTELPTQLRERYCEPVDRDFRVVDAVRERVRFSLHDLTSTAPPPGIGSFDLVCCRNVLIYFERVTQQAAMQLLRGQLREGGFLCLGEAEWPLPGVLHTLETLPHKSRTFRALGGATTLRSGR